jgi:phosphate transport system permease protein
MTNSPDQNPGLTSNPTELQRLDDSDIDIVNGEGQGFWLDSGFTWLTLLFTLCSVAVLFWMTFVILRQALPAIAKFGLAFLSSQDWDVGELKFGALTYVYGTIVTSGIALLIAVPVGLAVALLTSESFLPTWVQSPLAFLVELIAAIPSVIIGLWGIFVLIPALLPVSTWLYQHFSWIPLFGTEPLGPGMLPAGVILAIMILPTMAAISREVLLAVPAALRSASGALGATRWETIFRVILPTATSGILGAAILALGRALGETMAVTMVIGNSPNISLSLLDLASTIPSKLATEFNEALDPIWIGALMYLALILFILTLIVNMIAVLMVRALTQSSGSLFQKVTLFNNGQS